MPLFIVGEQCLYCPDQRPCLSAWRCACSQPTAQDILKRYSEVLSSEYNGRICAKLVRLAWPWMISRVYVSLSALLACVPD